MTLRHKMLLGYAILLLWFLGGFFPLISWLFERSIKRFNLPPDLANSLLEEARLEVILFGGFLLLLFALFAWLIFVFLTRPIRRLIQQIDCNAPTMPHIVVNHLDPDDDVTKLALTLNQLSRKIEQQIQVGKDFIANASHELKTPITIIRGFAETLHDYSRLPPPMAKEITEKILVNCKRMETLVGNLLTLADVENLPLPGLQECNVIKLLQHCVDEIRALYPRATLLFIPPEPLYVMADADLLLLAFMNLLHNAVKYSRGDPQVAIHLWASDQLIYISISDEGIGIPQEDLPHIFDRFYTVNKAHSRKLGGSGLGLSITRTIIEKHRGQITVTSTLGQGTTFTLWLPRSSL